MSTPRRGRTRKPPAGTRPPASLDLSLAAQRATQQAAEAIFSHVYSGSVNSRFFSSRGARNRARRSGDAILKLDRQNLVEFARILDAQTIVLRPFVRQSVNFTVGEGIRPVAAGDGPAQQAVDLFMAWAGDPRRCDVAGKMSFWDFQRAAQREKILVGDCLVVKTNRDPGGPALQFIEAERLDTPPGRLDAKTDTQNAVIEGVEVDDYGRALNYYVAPWSSRGLGVSVTEHKIISADHGLHVAHRDRAGMTRGVAVIAPALARLAMLDEGQNAVDIAHKVAACFAMVIQSSSPAAARSALQSGTSARDAQGDSITEPVRSLYAGEAGQIFVMNPGESASAVQGAHPSTNFIEYQRSVLMLVAAIMGHPIESVLLMNDRANYSVSRLAMLQSLNTAGPDREALSAQLNRPVYEWFVASMIESGALAGDINDYMGVTWRAPRTRLLDPQKDIQAMALEVSQNFASHQDIVEELGRDPDAVYEDRRAEVERFKELGITPGVMPGAPTPAAEPAAEQEST